MAIDLAGRVCIITGAAEGIGEALVNGFATRGAIVVATDLVEFSNPAAALCLQWDVADAARAETVMAEVVGKFGRIDAFVANAGVMPRQPWDEVTPENWRQVIGVNLDGSWYGAQAAARHMTAAGYGKIVFVSSIEIEMGIPVHTHYDATKAGVIGLTRALARAVGPQGVRVNCVMPGAVHNAHEVRQFPDQEAVARICAERQCIPSRISCNMVEPVFAFLCAAESDVITGQVICADQGMVHY